MNTRGVRNNNPGNIDRSPQNKWQGRMAREQMTLQQREEKRFEVFAAPSWGIRAICVLLISYQDRHGIHTVEGFIDRWAPPSENNTGAYVAAVAKAMNVAAKTYINIHEYRRMRPMVEAIIAHENAGYRYAPEVVEEGLRLAGIVKPGGEALVAPPRAATTAAATAAGIGGVAAMYDLTSQLASGAQQVLPALQTANAVVQATQSLPGWLRAMATLAVLVSAGASLYAWWRLRRAQKAVKP